MASDATPLMLITNAGLAVASTAGPNGGPYINITSFQIGSGYGYTPTTSQTAIQGNLLYTGAPTTYQNIGNNTVNIICEIPPDAGPWDFGEVALFLEDGTMFSIAVFDTPQTKFSALGTNVVTSYTLNCLLKLQQSTAVFQISTATSPPSVVDIYQWSDVYPPGVSANPDVPLYNVRELNEYGDSSILENTNDSYWTLGSTSYNKYQGNNGSPKFAVANSSTTWVEFPSSKFFTTDLTTVNRRFVILTASGFYRSVLSVVTSGSNYRFNLNTSNDGTYNNSPLPTAPAVSSLCEIFRDDQAGGTIYYNQIINPPSIPIASVGTPGLAYGGTGTYMPGGGQIQAYGLLQSPSTGTGRVFTNGDNLNNFYASGLYYTQSGSYGYPANMPIGWDCQIWIHNTTNGNTTQIAFPMSTGGGNPPYWRQGYNSGGNWTAWQPFWVNNTSSIPGNIWTAPGGATMAQVALLDAASYSVGTYTFAGAGVPGSGGFSHGQQVNLPGLAGTWVCASMAATGSDGRDWLYLRIN